jgi:hypothetical protein
VINVHCQLFSHCLACPDAKIAYIDARERG